jgi:hypothetical protein
MLTMILDMHLYITLQQNIGLKSFIVRGFSIFGTKAILVTLTYLGRAENSKKYFTAAKKSLQKIPQILLKNNEITTKNSLTPFEKQ